jgi:hypothetical protein
VAGYLFDQVERVALAGEPAAVEHVRHVGVHVLEDVDGGVDAED